MNMFRSAGEPVRLIIYGDFNCPFSALASARAADIEARALAVIDWRTVEHDEDIPLAGEATTPEVREAFELELAVGDSAVEEPVTSEEINLTGRGRRHRSRR